MKCLYAICRTNRSAGKSDYYVTHGSMGGETDAIGYSSAADARKFLSGQDAQRYIDQQLPPLGAYLPSFRIHHAGRTNLHDASSFQTAV